MRDYIEKLYAIIINILEGSYYRSTTMGDVYRWIHIYSNSMTIVDYVFMGLMAIAILIAVIKITEEEIQ